MPQCQFPIFCYFVFHKKLHMKYSQNWTTRSPKFLFSPDMRRSPKKSRRGARRWPHHRVVPPIGHATTWCGPPWCPLTSPLRLYKAFDAKNLNQSAFSQINFRSTTAIEEQFWGIKVSIPTPCRDGELPSVTSLTFPIFGKSKKIKWVLVIVWLDWKIARI
jgi:hypothetical protein